MLEHFPLRVGGRELRLELLQVLVRACDRLARLPVEVGPRDLFMQRADPPLERFDKLPAASNEYSSLTLHE